MADTHVEPVESANVIKEKLDIGSGEDDIEDSDVETDSNKEDDGEDDVGNEASEDEEPETSQKAGLANAMAKILGKKIPKHTQVILAKGVRDKEIKRKKQEKESKDDAVNVKVEDTSEEVKESIASLEKKRLWEEMGRTKPDPLERDKEKALQKIAQKGVVQLFNAVRKQQKVLEETTSGPGVTEAKRAKIVGKMTKGKFLDMLKGTVAQSGEEEKRVHKVKEPEEKQWSILREDFMMGAKMKDWDKQASGSDPDSDMPSDDSDNG